MNIIARSRVQRRNVLGLAGDLPRCKLDEKHRGDQYDGLMRRLPLRSDMLEAIYHYWDKLRDSVDGSDHLIAGR